MNTGIAFLAADAPKLAEPVASGWQLILAFLAGIAVIVVLITVVKLHPFLGADLRRADGGRRRGREPEPRYSSRSPTDSVRPQQASAS